jgi:outer membrane protein assembly factor BamE (lipoprotein component of BamABCDE complex)
MSKTYRGSIAAAGLSAMLAFSSGCLVAGTSSTTYSGTKVAPNTFDQIKPGVTTLGWVHATLGDPASKTQDKDDEVWKYTCKERSDSSSAVFLIFAGTSSKETINNVFIEFKDGVVINKWRG